MTQFQENQRVWFTSSTGHCLSAAVITKVGDCGISIVGEEVQSYMSVTKSGKCWMTGKLSTLGLTTSVKEWSKKQIGTFQGLPVLFWGTRMPEQTPDEFVITSDFDQLAEAIQQEGE